MKAMMKETRKGRKRGAAKIFSCFDVGKQFIIVLLPELRTLRLGVTDTG